MKALQKNKIWDLVSLLKGKKIVGCKSVFSINHKADRSIEQSKERLVAKGYTQTYDIDYQETLSPVEKLNIARVLLFLVANLDWPLHQFDLKNVFLHGDLEKEVYMDIPLNYIASSSIGVVSSEIVGTKFEMKKLGGLKCFFGNRSSQIKPREKQKVEGGSIVYCLSRVQRNSKGLCELLWLRKLLTEIGLHQ
ncbi:Retrovirus-related Pol polyprotein from transposon TNT 1-94 [Vitis vinifera]|uniref:Retrovirus-related Pol polyprotein from transposon TNT 1-94 n=1 Tax=Vitis vinifera TaxID=29760 RepID=A0A438C5A3_VITVI|nr:Retrovirus-related Pol polyprotein from transposon TNT 1-94 [Vitis vinifera]